MSRPAKYKLTASLIFMLFLASCSISGPHTNIGPPPASTQTLLVLPGAQNVDIKDVYPNSKANWKIATFETCVDAQGVFNFYHDTLIKDGWLETEMSSKTYHYGWSNNDIPIFYLDVTVIGTDQGKTKVKVEYKEDGRL